LHQFVLTSDAFLVAPDGIGTVLETLMIWQLLQVNHLVDTPLILVGKMWPGLVAWARESMLAGDTVLANVADLDIPQCVGTGEQAVVLMRKHHTKWLRTQGKAAKRRRKS
jgi:predicted Rossmann-fold nucleotide-binding protein